MLPDTWSVKVDESTGIPVVTICGKVTVNDFVRFLSATGNMPGYWSHDKYLWDMRHVTEFPSTSEIRIYANVARSEPTLSGRIAIVVDQDVHFGLVRMFEMLSEQPGVERRVFRDYDQAQTWLLSSGSPENPR